VPSPIGRLLEDFDPGERGAALHAFAAPLFPLRRSLTGNGVRQTLAAIGERIPLEIHEVPTGTPVFDWTVPREWNLRQAWIKDPVGRTVVDANDSSLHVVGYSVPIEARLPLAELRRHLHTLPEQPDLTPYRTSYYKESWGFCLPHRLLESLPEGEYEVRIDATLEDGSLTYGECLLPGTPGATGAADREVLISTHVCHPQLANDNLSGIAVTTFLAEALSRLDRRHSYRFLFLPGTIGAITWLARNEDRTGKIVAGLVAANLGDRGGFHFKQSRRGNTLIDRAVPQALRGLGQPVAVEPFVPFGYDERQYCSPGFDLPVGSLTRTPYGRYPEYHTSADDLAFLHPDSLGRSLQAYLAVADVLEGEARYLNLNPKCEPQLGRRGLYSQVGGATAGRERELALLWVLNLADGRHTLLDTAERANLPFPVIREAADALLEAGLLREIEENPEESR
jgi:aminopeptidase-like protein